MKFQKTWSRKLFGHKYFELDVHGFERWIPIFGFKVNFTTKTDHAGLFLGFSFLKMFDFDFSIYDSRHWNEEENCWYTYGPDGKAV